MLNYLAMNTTFLATCAALLLLLCCSSCENYHLKLEEEQTTQQLLEARIIQLEEEDRLINGAYSEALGTLNEINQTLSEITDRNKTMQLLIRQKELSSDSNQQQQIATQLEALREANDIANNKAKRLKAKARKYRVENAMLKDMIAQIDAKVSKLDSVLNKAQSNISLLENALSLLQEGIDSTDSELSKAFVQLKLQTNQLDRRNEQLKNTLIDLNYKTEFITEDAKAFLVCGNKKELRQAKILRLLSDKRLTADYQSKVQQLGSPMNFYEDDKIECGGGQIVRILPERDAESYKIVNNRVEILNNNAFWELHKMVVLIKQ